MTITYLDPRATASADIEPYNVTLDARSSKSEGEASLVIGLLANGFPDSENFLRCVETSLLRRLPTGTTTVFLNKGNASAAASPSQIDALATSVHVVVTAYGH